MAPPLFSQRGNVMDYAALGDISGVPHEFNDQNTFDYNYEFIVENYENRRFTPEKNSHYGKTYKNKCSDDTILSMAVAKSVIEAGDNIDDLEQITTKNLKEFVKLYPKNTIPGSYGPTFNNWANAPGLESMTGRPSFGNGSAMRVSAVGWAYNSLEKTLKAAEKTALPSHRHPEAIKGAQAIASAIYLARAGMSKDDIKAFLETKFDYDLDIKYEDYQNYNKTELNFQSEFCQTTVPMAICAFLASTDENGKGYEDCVRKAVTLGGDSDTIGAMAGSIAGAFYGLPKNLDTKCESLLNDHLNGVAKEFQKFVAARHTEPDKAELAEAMTKARLESYLLQQSKAGILTPPNQDPKVLDLLAKSEAARLFYEQVKAARQKNDKDLEDKLLENREDIVDAMEQQCKNSQELLDKYQSMTAWPVKRVKVTDVDEMVGRRKSGMPKTLPQRRAQVDHKAVAKLSMTRHNVVNSVLASKIGKYPEAPVKPKRAFLLARPFLSLYHMINGDYKSFDQKMREYTEDADLVKRITEDLDHKKALRETDQQGRTKDDVERGNEYEAQQRAAAMSEVNKKIEPKSVSVPADGEKAPKTEEKTERAASHEAGTLSRRILDVNRALEVVRLNLSVGMQTTIRENNSPLQEVGNAFFEKKVENYLAQVQSGKIQPNDAFMKEIADPVKFEDVYVKWLNSDDGNAFKEKMSRKYPYSDDLRETMEANPVLKSKLDVNANIADTKEFGEKLIAEDQKAHQKFLNTTLNVVTDGEMKMMLTDFSFINEFQEPQIQAQQTNAQTTEPAQNDVSATVEQPNVPV